MTYWLYISAAAVIAVAGTYILWGPSNRPTRRRKNSIPGLHNLGNTCFLNAVLQALSSSLSCINWLHKAAEAAQETKNENCFLINALLSILSALNRCDEDCSGAEVIKALRSHRWIISHEEHDAHELFHVLTTTIEEEILFKNSVLSLLEANELDKDSTANAEEVKKVSPSTLPMKLAFPMRGLLVNELKCNSCQYKHPARYDTFDSISLVIPSPTIGKLTLHDLLSKFISCELIQDVVCEVCPKPETPSPTDLRTTFSQQVSFGKLPECLCIHVQRTVWLRNGLSVKCYDYVQFPETLIMDYFVHSHSQSDRQLGATYTRLRLTGGNSNNCLRKSSNVDNLLFPKESEIVPSMVEGAEIVREPSLSSYKYAYILQAVIVHLGDVSSGHFITYRRVGSNQTHKWFYISDLEVKEVTFYEVSRACAYMLFYEKIRE